MTKQQCVYSMTILGMQLYDKEEIHNWMTFQPSKHLFTVQKKSYVDILNTATLSTNVLVIYHTLKGTVSSD